MKEIMPDFDFEKLDELVIVEATCRTEATIPNDSEEAQETFDVAIKAPNISKMALQIAQVVGHNAQGNASAPYLAEGEAVQIRGIVPLLGEHDETQTGNDDFNKANASLAPLFFDP